MRSTNTLPERLLQDALTERGQTYELHVARLAGTPDIVFDSLRVAVFVHGCFWHRHLGCDRARTPKKDTTAWLRRFARNVQRDAEVALELRRADWWVVVSWECDIVKDPDLVAALLCAELARRDVAVAA